MKVLVTGSTGTVGSEVVKALLERKADVRALIRDEQGKEKLPAGVEPVIANLLDPPAVEKALEGVDKLYLLNGVVPDELTQGMIVFNKARKLNLERVVYHSVFEADRFRDVPHFAPKVVIEDALKQFDVPYTIIRPNYFFQNDKGLKGALTGAGVYPMPLGSPGISAVDVRDIAEAAAIVLTTDGHEGKTCNLVGPNPLSGPGAAAIWSEALRRDVHYVGDDLDAWEAQMSENAPAWWAFDMRMMFQGYLERGFAANDGDVATVTKLLGHPPRSYEAFVGETVGVWQAGDR